MNFKYLIILFSVTLIGCKKVKQDNLIYTDNKTTQPKTTQSYKQKNDNKLIGLINDPDGYTNIRKKASSKSDIIGKILKGNYFYYEENLNSDWYHVTTQNGVKGYVHKSRIEKVNSELLISLKINSEDPSDFSFDRDTIIKIESLNEDSFFYIREFNYPKIKKKENKNNLVSFNEENIDVKIYRKKVNLNDYNFSNENNFTKIIPEKDYIVYGALGRPKYEIKNIQGHINNKIFNIEKKEYQYLFEPNLESAIIYKKNNNQIIIYMNGADASESYNVIFILDNNARVVKKYVYRGF